MATMIPDPQRPCRAALFVRTGTDLGWAPGLERVWRRCFTVRMIGEAELTDLFGAVLSRHPVDTRARRQNAVRGLLVAVPTGVLGLWAAAGTGGGRSGGGSRVVGAVIGVALVALYVAVSQAWRAVRGGPGEYFEVRERGLVHGSRRDAAGWEWDQVVSITIPGTPGTRGLARRLGNDYRCRLTLDDGARLHIDGHAAGAFELGRAVLRHSPDAVRATGDEWLVKARGWFLGGMAVLLAVGVAIVSFIATHQDTTRMITDANGSVSEENVPGLGDGTIIALAIGLAVCAIGAIACLVLFIRARMSRPR